MGQNRKWLRAGRGRTGSGSGPGRGRTGSGSGPGGAEQEVAQGREGQNRKWLRAGRGRAGSGSGPGGVEQDRATRLLLENITCVKVFISVLKCLFLLFLFVCLFVFIKH